MQENNTPVPVATTEVAPYDMQAFKDVISAAPAVLEKNGVSVVNATKHVEALIQSYEKSGMNDVLDEQMAITIDKIRRTEKNMNTERKPFTQLVDQIRKEFTVKENTMKELADRLQIHRDGYATLKAEEAQRKQREAELKLRVENERIEARRVITTAYLQSFEDYLLACSKQLSEIFEQTTLLNYDERLKWFQGMKFEYNEAKFNALNAKNDVDLDYGFQCEENKTQSETFAQTLLSELSESNFDTFSKRFVEEMTVKAKTFADRMPSKKEELEKLEKANADEKLRLAEEAEKRKAEQAKEDERLANEAKEKAQAQANMTATQEKTEAIVDAQAEVMADDTADMVKESFKIHVLNKVGYVLIFEKWFQDEAKSTPEEKIEKMTIARMIAYCEKAAIKTGEVIDSPYLEYEPVYKAK